MTNTEAQTRRPSTAEILAADELITAINSLRALGSRVVPSLELALERFTMDIFGSATDGEEVVEWLDESPEHTMTEAVARIFDGE